MLINIKNFTSTASGWAIKCLTKISPVAGSYAIYIRTLRSIPNFKTPKSFNEKLMVLKIENYSNNPLVWKCCDKFAVREYVESLNIKEVQLPSLIAKYDNAHDIDFSALPERFVLKCSHGSGFNIVCNDKKTLNIEKTVKQLNKWLNTRFGLETAETQYGKVRPYIMCEEMIEGADGKLPIDYKFYCFNGKVKSLLVCTNRGAQLRLNWFDENWNEQPYGKRSLRNEGVIKKPENLQKMIEAAEKLAVDFPFVRVDLYDDRNTIIFGELTFTPACCCASYYSETGLSILGSYLDT